MIMKQRVLMSFHNDGGGMGGFLSSEDEYDDGKKVKTVEYLDDVVAKITQYSYNEDDKLVS